MKGHRTFAVLAGVLVLAIVAQFFLATSGAFDTAGKDSAFAPHRALGYGIGAYAILLAVVGALIRTPGRLIGLTGKLIFGLHAVNALFIFGVAVTIVRQARAPSSTPAEPAPAA